MVGPRTTLQSADIQQKHTRIPSGIATCRHGRAKDMPISCKYTTRDGDAVAGTAYEVTKGYLKFLPGVESQMIKVRVYNDDEVKDDEDFFVDLYNPEPPTAIFEHATVRTSSQINSAMSLAHGER